VSIHDLIKEFQDTEIKMFRAKRELEKAIKKHKTVCKAVTRSPDASKGFKETAKRIMDMEITLKTQ